MIYVFNTSMLHLKDFLYSPPLFLVLSGQISSVKSEGLITVDFKHVILSRTSQLIRSIESDSLIELVFFCG